MVEFNIREIKPNASYQKNTLCRISKNRVLQVCEKHKDSNNIEIVNLEYILKEKQYALFGNEYRNPHLSAHGCKTTDVLTCIIDDEDKTIYSLIFDIKSNISSFSDNLLNENALLTAINEVKDFIEQLSYANMHKNSFLTFHKADGYLEILEIGIATKNFESKKFLSVADFLENLSEFERPENIQPLVWYKFKMNLMPYISEVQKIRNFANQVIQIEDKSYQLSVFILEKVTDLEYVTCIQVKHDKTDVVM